MITFQELQVANRIRCEESFHSIDDWSPWEWTNAMAGEVGECCNITKKMRRVPPANMYPPQPGWMDLEDMLKKEIADVVCYADLLATRMGWDLADLVQAKFNEVSVRVGSEVKL